MSVTWFARSPVTPISGRAYRCWLLCTTEAERPTTEVIVGDECYCEDTKKSYTVTSVSPVVWAQTGGGSGGSLPSGLIVMWHGLLSAIPAGWLLCDGTNGTPDLRDKFVKGAAAGQNPGGTGGSATHTHADHPALSHSGSAVADHASHTHQYTDVPNHIHPVSDPGHSHLTQRYPTATGGSSGFTIDTSMSGTPVDNTLPVKASATGITGTDNPTGGVPAGTTQGPSAALSHAVTQPADHAAQSHQPANGEPPYYSVAYIMKS